MTKKPVAESGVEDLLQQAMVHQEEQPYKVPGNWLWVRLGSICNNVQYGYTAKSSVDLIGPKLLRITDIQNNCVDWRNVPQCQISQHDYEKFRICINDIVIARTGATTGKSYLITEDVEAVFASYLIRINLNKKFNHLYLYYFMHSDNYWNQINDLAQGIAQPGVNATKLQSMIYPLPPLPEQQRIVSAIEALFAKLDRARELLEEVQDAFEEHKATILARAFRGELTARWREERGLKFEKEWKKDSFDSVASIKSNLVPPEKYGEYPHIAPDNIEKKTGRLIGFNTIGEDGMTSAKHLFYAGQILYSKIRPYLSKLIVAEFDGLCSADMYPIETVLETKYLYYYMLSEDFLAAASTAGSRSVLPKINQKELNSLPVVFPSNSEQQEIVRILDDLLDKSSAAADLCDQIDQIDQLKKTILAKAFRGELETNDPMEESAEKLLREVRQQWAASNVTGGRAKPVAKNQ